jgi:hypothetical protein
MGFLARLFRRRVPFIEGLTADEYTFHINAFVDSLKCGGDNPHALNFQEHILGIIKEGRPDNWQRSDSSAIDVTPGREEHKVFPKGEYKFTKRELPGGQVSYIREEDD